MKSAASVLVGGVILIMLSLPAIVWKSEIMTPNPPAEVRLVDVVPAVIGGVVHVKAVTAGWQGSGFLVDANLVVTARHVVEGGGEFVVTLNDGREIKSHRAMSAKKYDVGFLLLDYPVDANTPTLTVGPIRDCRLGQAVFAIGSPFGHVNMNSVTLGVISRVDCDLSEEISDEYGWPEVTFQTDTNGEPGNSGCPVFSLDGVVRGILVGGFSNGIIYCVPSDVFMRDLGRVKLLYALDSYQFEEPKAEKPGYTTHSFDPSRGF